MTVAVRGVALGVGARARARAGAAPRLSVLASNPSTPGSPRRSPSTPPAGLALARPAGGTRIQEESRDERVLVDLAAACAVRGAALLRRDAVAVAARAGARAARTTARRHADTLRRVVPLPEVEVSTTRARRARADRAHDAASATSCCARNWGQDTPMLLATAARRLRVLRRRQRHRLLVPLDPRLPAAPDQRARERRAAQRSASRTRCTGSTTPTCWPRRARSQIQRGVGSALYGAASLGGSVNLETSPFSAAPETRVDARRTARTTPSG